MSSSEEKLAPFLTVTEVIVYPMASLSVAFFLYGTYTIVFVLSVHVLYHRKAGNAKAHQLYMCFTIALYLLATIWIASSTWAMFLKAIIEFNAASSRDFGPLTKHLIGGTQETVSEGVSSITSSLINLTADLMLIHRCYVIWSSNKILLCLLLATSIILNAIDLGSNIGFTIGVSNTTSDAKVAIYLKSTMINNGTQVAIVVFNMMLTLMTAGRIWWISQQARQLMGRPVNMKYSTIVAIIIESGLLYAGTMLINLVVDLTVDPIGANPANVQVQLYFIATLMSALAPTLIIVRAAYGKTVESVNQVVSTIQFNAAAQPERFVDTGRVTVNSAHAEQSASVDGSSEEQLEKESV